MVIPDSWEYKFVTINVEGDLRLPQHELNQLGDTGWEVVALVVRGSRAEWASTVATSRSELSPGEPMPPGPGLPLRVTIPTRPVEYREHEEAIQYVALLKRRKV